MHAAAGLAQRRGRAFADVAEAGDHRHLAGHHHVGAAADAVDQRFTAAVEVVEFRLGDAVVDVDRREQQAAFLGHLIEPVHAGGGFLGDAAHLLGEFGVPAGLILDPLLDGGEQHFLFLVAGMGEHAGIGLGLQAEVQKQRGVAAVVEDHVRKVAVRPFEDAVGVIPVVDEALALDREHRHAGLRDRGGGVVLRRIDVARRPAHIGAQMRERLDQHRGLDGHVQRAGDAGAAQRLPGPIFLARRHQAGHFGLGDSGLVAAPGRERDVLDDIVAGFGFRLGGSGHDGPMQHA